MDTKVLLLCVIGLGASVFAQRGTRCNTPNGEAAYCISIYACQPLLAVIRDRTPQTVRFLQASQCGYEIDPLVCCGTVGSFQQVGTQAPPATREPPVLDSQKQKLLPPRGECGVQLGNKILNGERTDLDEFPWMALLEYRKNGKSVGFSCGGMLISNRYVLTAAHCVVGRITRVVGDLFSVRLGEYDTSSTTDCVGVADYRECAEPHQDIRVEEAIAHSQYQDGSNNRYHDIALARLARNVQTNDFVKPICLPTAGERSSAGQKLYVAGWGLTEKGVYSTVKLKLQVPVVDQRKCADTFSRARVTVADTQLCAGGEKDKDSCQGDSGGPLMRTFTSDAASWYVEGIVSFGAKCGTKDVPGIYTRVAEYLDWILQNIRP